MKIFTPHRMGTARSTHSTARYARGSAHSIRNGPVNALDRALRKGLGAFYPQLDAVHLVDYKVRILDGGSATGAKTRVVIDSVAGGDAWSTMGVGENIISASALALADSLEYALLKGDAAVARRSERSVPGSR